MLYINCSPGPLGVVHFRWCIVRVAFALAVEG
jgi:hypothetical protein